MGPEPPQSEHLTRHYECRQPVCGLGFASESREQAQSLLFRTATGADPPGQCVRIHRSNDQAMALQASRPRMAQTCGRKCLQCTETGSNGFFIGCQLGDAQREEDQASTEVVDRQAWDTGARGRDLRRMLRIGADLLIVLESARIDQCSSPLTFAFGYHKVSTRKTPAP